MFYCNKCKKFYPEDSNRWCCDCGAPFSYAPSVSSYFPKNKIKDRNQTIWRYQEALPMENKEEIVSLGEGLTPLIPASFEGQKILFKLDYISPTGSYKDRGTSFFVSKLKEHKIKKSWKILPATPGHLWLLIVPTRAFHVKFLFRIILLPVR